MAETHTFIQNEELRDEILRYFFGDHPFTDEIAEGMKEVIKELAAMPCYSVPEQKAKAWALLLLGHFEER